MNKPPDSAETLGRDTALALNLGCGKRKLAGFVNVDCRVEVGPDVQMNLDDTVEFERRFEGRVVEIIAEDVLEHLPRRRALTVLGCWVKCLRQEGRIRLQAPDMRELCRLCADDDTLARRLYGNQDYPENSHKSGFTLQSLTSALRRMGLQIVSARIQNGNAIIEARK